MLDRNEVLLRWAEIVVRIWEERVRKLKITDTLSLLTSFVHHVTTNAGGDVGKIEFAFQYYGKMVDMGVGKGVTIENRMQVDHSRIAQPWYTMTFLREFRKLQYILAENYAGEAAVLIAENIRDGSVRSTRHGWTKWKSAK